jgi:hypothetical protein
MWVSCLLALPDDALDVGAALVVLTCERMRVHHWYRLRLCWPNSRSAADGWW